MKIVINILMSIYFMFSISQSIPCIVKLIKTKESNDYSLLNRLFQYIGLVILTIANTINAIDMTLDWIAIASIVAGYVDLLALTSENILILKYYKKG